VWQTVASYVMVRYVALIKLKAGVSQEKVDEWIAATERLSIQGMRSLKFYRDLGLREGNKDYAVVADFDDEDGYRRYDTDFEHARIRQELAVHLIETIDCCQFRV
jgi:hypothetical protein